MIYDYKLLQESSMQISNSLQNNIVPSRNNEPLKSGNTDTAQQVSTTLTSSINKDAFDYVDLGEDISAYTIVNPKQEQTNQELINYLSNLMNDKTDEGRKNLQAYDLSSYHAVNADKKTIWGYDDEHPEEILYGVNKVTQRYMNNLNQTTKEEFDSIQLDKFKNLYSFSDAFAKTDKFQELYANYVNQNSNNKQIEDARAHGKSMAETFGSKSFFTSQVGSQSLSKSEIIEQYTKISQDLHTLKIPLKDTTYSETYIKQIDDSINLFEKITSDLKQIWNYGNLDVKS